MLTIEELDDLIQKNIWTAVEQNRRMHLYKMCLYLKDNNIQGDLVETGVFRGGCSMIMAFANKKLNRQQWLIDSFEGIPNEINLKYGVVSDDYHTHGEFYASLNEVKDNFIQVNLNSKNIKYLKGWFKDILPNSGIGNIALLRFDGDLYSSTLEVLENLYPKVVTGGVVIIDDWCIPACKRAVEKYFTDCNLSITPLTINDEIATDECGVYWIK